MQKPVAVCNQQNIKGLNPEDIIYFKACDGQVKIKLQQGVEILCHVSLSNLEQHPSLKNFYRINRRYFIHSGKIASFELNAKKSFVTMKDGKEISIPVRKRADFLRKVRNQFVIV